VKRPGGSYPIPTAALDERLGWIGTSGSGKTYNAGGGVERLLQARARVVIVDPLGVWWGLRLLADGKTPSPFNVAIFGGPHGDLPLNEHVGALIGETAATMAESCIIDLSEFGSKSADRRFMAAFLESVYRKANGDPFHLVVDEADLFAPQKPQKGDEVLLGHMENIVRRGRVKGFIPWLISQRPAVLNKNVLSQVDGLIAFMLTASQDRKPLGDWVSAQADEGAMARDQWPAADASDRHRRRLASAAPDPQDGPVPAKVTFDSSATPKRGEKRQRRELKPLDLDKLKGKLATVEQEQKANDPRHLKVQSDGTPTGPQQRILNAIAWWTAFGIEQPTNEQVAFVAGYSPGSGGFNNLKGGLRSSGLIDYPVPGKVALTEAGTEKADAPAIAPTREAFHAAVRAKLSAPQWRVLEPVIAAHPQDISSDDVATAAGYSAGSGGFNNLRGSLRTLTLIDYPSPGRVRAGDWLFP
jgi:hypothetical protein